MASKAENIMITVAHFEGLIESLKSQNRELEMKLAVLKRRTQKDNVHLNTEIAILYDELGIPFGNLEEETPYDNLTELNSVIRKSKVHNLRKSIDSENKENKSILKKSEQVTTV